MRGGELEYSDPGSPGGAVMGWDPPQACPICPVLLVLVGLSYLVLYIHRPREQQGLGGPKPPSPPPSPLHRGGQHSDGQG